MGGRRKPLGDEIPLLSWSLHLLGEAEWAVVRGGIFHGLRPAASRLILVLKREPSREVGREAEPVSVARILSFFSEGVRCRVSGAGRAEHRHLREFIRWRDPG